MLKRKSRLWPAHLLINAEVIDAQGTWSGGMCLWIVEEITGWGVLVLRST